MQLTNYLIGTYAPQLTEGELFKQYGRIKLVEDENITMNSLEIESGTRPHMLFDARLEYDQVDDNIYERL